MCHNLRFCGQPVSSLKAAYHACYGAVTYKQMKATDAEWTENLQKSLSRDGSRLSGGECRRGSRKERIRTGQRMAN